MNMIEHGHREQESLYSQRQQHPNEGDDNYQKKLEEVVVENDDESDLPEHGLSMRKACRHCLSVFHDLEPRLEQHRKRLNKFDSTFVAEARRLSSDHQQNRDRACREFWASLNKSDTDVSGLIIPHFHFKSGAARVEKEQECEFQQEFHDRNLPCLVTGLEAISFSLVNQSWRTHYVAKDSSIQEGSEVMDKGVASEINPRWFLETLGGDCEVPLRYNADPSSFSLDEEGRADECQTRKVTMRDWIQMLQSYDGGNNEVVECTEDSPKPIYYLKDWHLQQILECKRNHTSLQSSTELSSQLYVCPTIFPHDLLNSFLTKFTKGDYRFCYWGPANSSTLRHSDVLHSFSWSYNVQGTKEWTFFSPFDDHKTLKMIQKTGQAIFVPATWQHQVINLEETISINHNWITTANIDLTWQCLMAEMVAIRDELMKWQGDNSKMGEDTEAYENMLRGCVGLDVSSFFFMALLRLVDVIKILLDHLGESDSGNDQERKEILFGVFRLTAILDEVMTADEDLVQLNGRLEATMQSDMLARKGAHMAKFLITWVNSLS